jgi:hypothetical protein
LVDNYVADLPKVGASLSEDDNQNLPSGPVNTDLAGPILRGKRASTEADLNFGDEVVSDFAEPL